MLCVRFEFSFEGIFEVILSWIILLVQICYLEFECTRSHSNAQSLFNGFLSCSDAQMHIWKGETHI